MNLLNLRTVKIFTKIFVFILAFFVHVTVRAWEVDMSRRQSDLKKSRGPASLEVPQQKEASIVESFFDGMGPTQELVILHTENGFVPETLRVKKGQNYRVHIVNVNEKEKNVSFMLDAFAQHHATYFGLEKSFQFVPKMEGIYSFHCPETARQGKIVVIGDERKPASE